MAIAATAVATTIAGLSVTGLTIKDLDGFKDEILNRDCPILIPAPQYFTDARVKYDSFLRRSLRGKGRFFTLTGSVEL